MDLTHLFLFIFLGIIVGLILWDERNRRAAVARSAATLERVGQSLERISEHTRHTAQLAATAAQTAAHNEQLTLAVLGRLPGVQQA